MAFSRFASRSLATASADIPDRDIPDRDIPHRDNLRYRKELIRKLNTSQKIRT